LHLRAEDLEIDLVGLPSLVPEVSSSISEMGIQVVNPSLQA